jgi:hypothetical protein
VCQADDETELKDLVKRTMESHIKWLRDHGMVVNSAKTEMMGMGLDLQIEVDGAKIESKKSMRVLGLLFDDCLSWEPQALECVKTCKRMKPALWKLKRRLTKTEFSQVITSHYYPRLYFSSEVWLNCLSSKLSKIIASVHYHPLRMLLNDFKVRLSRKTIDKLPCRASPRDYNEFKIAKMLIHVCDNAAPFLLFHEIVSHSLFDRRSMKCPKFYDTSRLKIGQQAFANRLNKVSRKINFDWNGIELSRDTLRIKLKSSFFTQM